MHNVFISVSPCKLKLVFQSEILAFSIVYFLNFIVSIFYINLTADIEKAYMGNSNAH